MSSSTIPILGIAMGLLLSSCIDRSNPFDPINAGSARREQIRQEEKPALDSLLEQAALAGGSLGGFAAAFALDSAFDRRLTDSNVAIRARNQDRMAANAAVEAANLNTVPLDSLRMKEAFEMLSALRAFGPYADFDARRNSLQLAGVRAAALMAAANSRHAPLDVYPLGYRDSALAGYSRDSAAFARLQARIDSANLAVSGANGIVSAYNAGRDSANAVVRAYNDLIAFRKAVRDRPLFTRSDSLQAGTFVAKAGDSMFLGPGTFNVDLRFTNSGTADSPIVIRGYPGQATILRAATGKDSTAAGSAMVLSNRAYIRFEDVVFRKGGVSGIKLESGCRNISFRRCRFDSSATWGLEVIDSDIEMMDCVVRENGGGMTVRQDPTKNYRLRLVNNLIARNRGVGLAAVSLQGEISNATIADNGGQGIHMNSPLLAVTIANTIVSGNSGIGIFRESGSANQEGFIVKECDVYGNLPQDWSLAGMDSTRAESLRRSNLAIKPEFVDAAAFDYRLMPGSELAGYDTRPLPIVIGYRP